MSVETIGEKYMIKETLIKIKKEWPVWSLYHREYIIGFVLGWFVNDKWDWVKSKAVFWKK